MIRGAFQTRRATPADRAYNHAMAVSTDLIEKMRERSSDPSPMRAMMADIWAQNHNVPYVTSVFETVQELNAAIGDRDRK